MDSAKKDKPKLVSLSMVFFDKGPKMTLFNLAPDFKPNTFR